MRLAVRNAAKLAVYELIMIRVNNHQAHVTKRPDIDLLIQYYSLQSILHFKFFAYFGMISIPCCKNADKQNHNVFDIVKSCPIASFPFSLYKN